jgi:hypothetical protein
MESLVIVSEVLDGFEEVGSLDVVDLRETQALVL